MTTSRYLSGGCVFSVDHRKQHQNRNFKKFDAKSQNQNFKKFDQKSKQWQNYNVNEQKGANMTGIAPKSQYGPDLIDLSNLTRLFSVFEMYFILFLACFCTKETSSKFK
eukprot:32947_1